MRSHRGFSAHFKIDAVWRAYPSDGAAPGEIARELDVSTTMLGRWRRELEAGRYGVIAREKWEARAQHPSVPAVVRRQVDQHPVKNDSAQLRMRLAKITIERDMLKQMLAHYLKDEE